MTVRTLRLASPATTPPADRLAQDKIDVLGTLAVCSQASALLAEDAKKRGEIPPYMRDELRKMSVAIAANVESLTERIRRLG